MAIAWATTIVARTLGAGAATDLTEVAPPVLPPPAAVAAPVEADAAPPAPTLPDGGLFVLRYTPAPKPEPEVHRVVVTQQAPATAATAPTTKTSSGS